MKLIFLDIDGVLVTSQTEEERNNRWNVRMFDTTCVATLNFILQETDAEMILSSDWRYHYSLQEIKEIFDHNNVIKSPIDFTPKHPTNSLDLEGDRIGEIKAWLDVHAWKDDIVWVAVDDYDLSKLSPNFVHCHNDMEGIKGTSIKEKIVGILQKI